MVYSLLAEHYDGIAWELKRPRRPGVVYYLSIFLSLSLLESGDNSSFSYKVKSDYNAIVQQCNEC